MEKRFYFIRHCEAEGQPPQAPLTEKGAKQAEALSEFFSTIKMDRIISSPFLRAIKSIEPTSQKHNVKIEIDERLSERTLSTSHMSDWLDKLKATFEDRELSYEGGESSREAADRIVSVVEELLKSGSETALIVTHGNLMSLLLNHYNKEFGFEQWKSLANPDVYCLRFTKNQTHLERLWDRV